MNMKKIVIFIFGIMIFGCSSLKNTQVSKKQTAGKHILPPDVPSNKYSKTRQGG